MTVYRLEHFHGATEEYYGDGKSLGVFSSLQKAEEAKEEYRKMRGFSAYPDGFFVFSYPVQGETECDHAYVYVAEVYFHDKTYEFEKDVCFGVFGNMPDAQASVSRFRAENRKTANIELSVECTINRYVLDRLTWPEGFLNW